MAKKITPSSFVTDGSPQFGGKGVSRATSPVMPVQSKLAQQKVMGSKTVGSVDKKSGSGTGTTLGWANFGLNLIATIGNIWMAMEQLSLAKKQFSFAKNKFNKNFAMALYELKDKMLIREKGRALHRAKTVKEREAIDNDTRYDDPNNAGVYIPGVTDKDGNYVPFGEDASKYKNQNGGGEPAISSIIDRVIKDVESGNGLSPDIRQLAEKHANPNVDYAALGIKTASAEDPASAMTHLEVGALATETAKSPDDVIRIESEYAPKLQEENTSILTSKNQVEDNQDNPSLSPLVSDAANTQDGSAQSAFAPSVSPQSPSTQTKNIGSFESAFAKTPQVSPTSAFSSAAVLPSPVAIPTATAGAPSVKSPILSAFSNQAEKDGILSTVKTASSRPSSESPNREDPGAPVPKPEKPTANAVADEKKKKKKRVSSALARPANGGL